MAGRDRLRKQRTSVVIDCWSTAVRRTAIRCTTRSRASAGLSGDATERRATFTVWRLPRVSTLRLTRYPAFVARLQVTVTAAACRQRSCRKQQ